MRPHTRDQALATHPGTQIFTPSRFYNSKKFSNTIIKLQDQRTYTQRMDAQLQRGDWRDRDLPGAKAGR